jgi:ectoine hydroxylase-related dioxygenase (phytanoyl-CoA dioxygenase family)
MNILTSVTKSPVTEAQVRQYHNEGFLVLRNLFSPVEAAELQAEASRLLERTDLIDINNIRCRWKNNVETDKCGFDCFDPVIDLSPLCARIVRDARILEAVGSLYGEPACLFKDKLIFKPPGAEGYALHQDYISWESFPASFVTVILAIDATSSDNGATEVFPGYHKGGNMSPNDGQYHELPLSAVDVSKGVKLDLEAGDLAIFSAFTPHRSAANQSKQWRRQLYLSYNSFSDGGEQRDKHYAEFKVWLQNRYAEYGKTNTYFR